MSAFNPRSNNPVAPWRQNRDRLDGMSLGIEMAGSVVLGGYLGKLFDDHFLTGPWGMMFFVLAGILAAGKAVLRCYRQARQVMRQPEPGAAVAGAMETRQGRAETETRQGRAETEPRQGRAETEPRQGRIAATP